MSGSSEKPVILVVDDELNLRNLMERFLTANGYEALTASDGETALELLRTRRPNVVLLDIDLPGMNGLQILKIVRDFDKRVPVLMVTASSDKDAVDWSLKEGGAVEYLVKPFDLSRLKEILASLLEKSLSA